MARYINKDEFIAKIQDNFCTECNNYNGIKCKSCGIDDTIEMVENADEADVVPKSEVDRAYERGFERGKKDNVCGFSAEEIAQKAEKIAIELEAMRMAANSYKMHYENARVEVAREIFEEIDKLYVVNGSESVSILDYRFHKGIAELKKKYTEGAE